MPIHTTYKQCGHVRTVTETRANVSNGVWSTIKCWTLSLPKNKKVDENGLCLACETDQDFSVYEPPRPQRRGVQLAIARINDHIQRRAPPPKAIIETLLLVVKGDPTALNSLRQAQDRAVKRSSPIREASVADQIQLKKAQEELDSAVRYFDSIHEGEHHNQAFAASPLTFPSCHQTQPELTDAAFRTENLNVIHERFLNPLVRAASGWVDTSDEELDEIALSPPQTPVPAGLSPIHQASFQGEPTDKSEPVPQMKPHASTAVEVQDTPEDDEEAAELTSYGIRVFFRPHKDPSDKHLHDAPDQMLWPGSVPDKVQDPASPDLNNSQEFEIYHEEEEEEEEEEGDAEITEESNELEDFSNRVFQARDPGPIALHPPPGQEPPLLDPYSIEGQNAVQRIQAFFCISSHVPLERMLNVECTKLDKWFGKPFLRWPKPKSRKRGEKSIRSALLVSDRDLSLRAEIEALARSIDWPTQSSFSDSSSSGSSDSSSDVVGDLDQTPDARPAGTEPSQVQGAREAEHSAGDEILTLKEESGNEFADFDSVFDKEFENYYSHDGPVEDPTLERNPTTVVTPFVPRERTLKNRAKMPSPLRKEVLIEEWFGESLE